MTPELRSHEIVLFKSVVEAMRYNSTSELLDVPDGSYWFFVHVMLARADGSVVEQRVRACIRTPKSELRFGLVVGTQDQVAIALLEAMRTNTTVRGVGLRVRALHLLYRLTQPNRHPVHLKSLRIALNPLQIALR